MIPVVTAIDRAYLPGLKALYNSFLANAGPGFDFHCIVHGDIDLLLEVAGLGMTAIPAPDWLDVYPTTKEWPEQLPAMYSR